MRLGISTYSFPWRIGTKDFAPPTAFTPGELLEYAASKNMYQRRLRSTIFLKAKAILKAKALMDATASVVCSGQLKQ